MISLEDVIRTRVDRQLLPKARLDEVLDVAWWIYDDYSISARLGNPVRSAVKRLQAAYKLPIDRVYRVVNLPNMKRLSLGYQQPVQDQELVDLVPEDGISRPELAQQLSMTVKKLNYRLRKEQDNWNLLKIDDLIRRLDDLVEEKPPIKDVIIEVLKRYPYCSIDQLELLTGLDRSQLATPITSLHRDNRIVRGITMQESHDELFCLPQQQLWNGELPVLVLEKRDALVQVLELERGLRSHGSNYWLFVDGLPRAEFDLKREKKIYRVTNLYRFEQFPLELNAILDRIREWGKDHGLEVSTDGVNDATTSSYRFLTSYLQERGYQLDNKALVLDRYKEAITGDDPSTPEVLSWQLIGPWLRNRQFLSYDGTAADILYELGQLDDIQSLAYRLGCKPNQIDFNQVVFIAGINYRLGFVHIDDVDHVVRGWPRQSKLQTLDQQLLGFLDKPKTTMELMIETGDSPISVKQRLRYLERSRVIRKLLPGSLDMDSCLWVKFSHDIGDINKPYAGKRAMASVGHFVFKILRSNPPLTKSQLSRFLGMTNRELEPLLKTYISKNRILEGYFVQYVSEVQYTVPEILDTIQPVELDEDEDISVSERVDLLPLTDPYAMLHLFPLVLDDSSLQTTQRYHEMAEQWVILWDGEPVGYLVKQPTEQMLLDYELFLRIRQQLVSSAVIAGTLQKFVQLQRVWYGDEGKIVSINDIPVSDRSWKHIHFLIESIGIEMD